MILLVCGGRFYANRKKVYEVLDAFAENHIIDFVLHGSCYKGGADILAEDWAKKRQTKYVGVPAQWTLYGDAAGSIRNARMLDEYPVDHVIAFPGGNGTKDMIKQAHSMGIDIDVIVDKEDM